MAGQAGRGHSWRRQGKGKGGSRSGGQGRGYRSMSKPLLQREGSGLDEEEAGECPESEERGLRAVGQLRGRCWGRRVGSTGTSCKVATIQELLQAQGLWPHAHQAHAVLVQEPLEVAEVPGDPATHHAAEAPQAGHHARLLLPQAPQLYGLRVGG